MNEYTLFKRGNDSFVNEGIAQLAVELSELDKSGNIRVTPDDVLVETDDVKTSLRALGSIISDMCSKTHRRTSLAHQLDSVVPEETKTGDKQLIKSPSEAFPDNVTINTNASIDGKSVTYDEVKTIFGVEDPSEVGMEEGDEKNLVSRRPTYVGVPLNLNAFDRVEETLTAMESAIVDDEFDQSYGCNCCGRTDLPRNEYNDNRVEYGQSMTPLITKSARPRGVGSTSAKSYYEGRCTACVIAGFTYTLIDKAVMPYSLSDGEFLVFSPVGNLQELVNVRKNYNLKVDTPTKNNKAPLSTFDSMNTESRKMQYLKFIEQANRNFIEKSKGGLEELSQERKYLDLGVTSYITTSNKSGNPVRGFRAFNSVDSSEHIRNIIRSRNLDDGTEFWPISDVIESFAEIDDVDSSEEEGVQAKDKLASGLLTGDTHKICDGIFNLIKIYSSSGSPTSGLIELKKSKKYFTEIMDTPNNNRNSDASFSEDERQSISTVGSAFGEQFSDEMSVLISLQNSNSPSQLLRAMEKAGMQSFKDSSTQNEDTVYTLASNEDVERVLGLITDSDRFETTKQMLVIHASLSAHYSNVVSDDN